MHLDRSTISASRGQGRGVVWVSTLQRGGGARRWLTRWRTHWTTTTLLSEGRALAAVVGALPGKPYWTRVGTDSPRRLRHPWRGGARRAPTSHSAPRLEGEEVEGATPSFLALVRHRAGQGGAHENPHHLPSPSGVAPSTVIPGGKAIERLFALMVDECVSM